MPRGRRAVKYIPTSPFKLALLLVEFILIKIGQVPFETIRFVLLTIIEVLKSIWFVITSFWWVIKFIINTIIQTLFKFNLPSFKGRGRPRKLGFIPYHLNRFKLYFKRRVSLKTKLGFAVLLVIGLLYLYTNFIFTTAYQLPSPDRLTQNNSALTTEFFDRNGKLLYRMYEGRNRILINLGELPSYFIDATIAAEDRNFYKHPGIDIVAIFRAVKKNWKNQESGSNNQNLEGASTLTQQLIKNTLLTPEKTYTRKIKEIILALWAERVYTKQQILQMYVNEAPYGGDLWGADAASWRYFGRSARNLTLGQAAFLAGLPVSPTQFSPYGSNPELGKQRQKEVLRRMVENKFITQYQADLAFKEDLHIQAPINNIKAPHFVMYVKDLLSEKYGQRAVSQGGLKITTTLDLGTQEKVEEIVESEVDKLGPLNVANGAAMVTDAKTGQILAMVGSKNYHESQFGSYNVTTALRQPGSSIKVVTYITGFKQGFTPGNTILDVPVVFRDNWGNGYAPVNYDGAYHGAVSIRQALGSSYNIPAVKMLAMVGVDEVVQTAKDMGITTFTDPKRYGLALTLGGAEVKMVDMMTVYGTISQMGQKHQVSPILKVIDSEGNLLEEFEDKPTQVITPEVAYLITSILTDNNARKSAFGENSLLKLSGHTAAVKTGTSDNKRDNLTFGFTPEIVVGVWVGNNNNMPMNPALTSGVTGAAPIWNKIMTTLLQGKPDLAFQRPSGIIDVTVDGRRDIAINSQIPKSVVRVSERDSQTVFSDPYSTFATGSASQPDQAAIKDNTNN